MKGQKIYNCKMNKWYEWKEKIQINKKNSKKLSFLVAIWEKKLDICVNKYANIINICIYIHAKIKRTENLEC